MLQAATNWIPMTGFDGYNNPNDGNSIYLLLTANPDNSGRYIMLLGIFDTSTTKWVDPVTGVDLVNQHIFAYHPVPSFPQANQSPF